MIISNWRGQKFQTLYMVLSFVYIILMNGSLKHDTKATDGGGLLLTFHTRVLGKVEGKGLQKRNGSRCMQG